MDALINYISGLKDKEKTYWPADLHVIGKGINWFHSVIWPALLLSAGYKLPKKLLVHGYVNIGGKKMSKSLGNAVSPLKLLNKYPGDVVRYSLLRGSVFEDFDYSEEILIERNNNELANSLGNLVSRVLTLAEKNAIPVNKMPLDKNLTAELKLKDIVNYMETYELNNALKEIFRFVNEANKHVNEKRPWELKDKKLEKVLYNLLESIRIIAILTSPFLPTTAGKINEQLGVKLGSLKDCKFGLVKEYNVKKGEILFKKI